MRRLVVLAALLLAAAAAHAADDIRYVLRFVEPENGYVEVEASYPTRGAKSMTVMMPVWIPGSYLVREFARNVEGVAAETDRGTKVAVTKSSKNRWQFPTAGAKRVTLRYRVYGHELGVRTNFIDSELALINGPATFIVPIDQLSLPSEVTVELPKQWSRAISGLPSAGAPNRFRATDYDRLVDSPIVAGNPTVHEFSVSGVPHVLANYGGEQMWDGAKAAADVKKIAEQHRKLWGLFPYDRYVFFNLIVDTGGGLEHLSSTVLFTRRFAMRTRKTYIDWLSLVSHEHFHAWNVKKLRPVELGPFDYESENYTTNLWIAEGFTDYYGDLQLARAGLITRKEYLELLSKVIESLQTAPGRLVTPAAVASYDAWIKHYRPDENTPNTTISYYTKGNVVAWILDAKIRKATNDGRSLDDVMRTAYARFAGTRGYATADFMNVVREIGGAAAASWLERAVSTTEELDYADALQWFGLKFAKPSEPKPGEEKPKKVWLGVTTPTQSGRLVISRVQRDSPGYEAGLQEGEEIIAIDGIRVLPDQWESRLEQYKPGDKATLLVSRRGILRSAEMTLADEPPKSWNLEVVTDPTPEPEKHLKSWLGAAGESQPK